MNLRLARGDITTIPVDAIVNAANNTLMGGGGVDGAIHAAAGPSLLEECRGLGGCDPGDAKATKAYDLPAKWVIHTVGPVWWEGREAEVEVLARAYRRCLEVADEIGAKTVSFPAVSTGAYRFPLMPACLVAMATLMTTNTQVEESVLVAFDEPTFASLKAVFLAVKV